MSLLHIVPENRADPRDYPVEVCRNPYLRLLPSPQRRSRPVRFRPYRGAWLPVPEPTGWRAVVADYWPPCATFMRRTALAFLAFFALSTLMWLAGLLAGWLAR